MPYKSIVAQTTVIRDSFPVAWADTTNTELFSMKGDLRKLCDNLMLSYKIYHTGDTAFVNENDRKNLSPIFFFQKGKSPWFHISKDDFYKIPIDSIESIEATYDPKRNAAIGGTRALECIIKITLKENTNIE